MKLRGFFELVKQRGRDYVPHRNLCFLWWPPLAFETQQGRFFCTAGVVTCAVEDHVMASSASGLKDGAAIWSLLDDLQERMRQLRVTGEPPDEFDAIRTRLVAEQAAAGFGAELRLN